MMRLHDSVWFAVLFHAACVPTYSVPNPEHCWNASGDGTCRSVFTDRPFCSHDEHPCNANVRLGCVSEVPMLDACYSPCGGNASILEDASCLMPVGESESSEGDSVSSDESGPMESESSSSSCGICPEPLVCDTDECVECTINQQRACVTTQSWCDPATNSCQPCTDHFQCPGQAGCHIAAGTCLPPDRVFQVHSQWGMSFAEAVEMLEYGDGTILIHETSPSMLETTLTLANEQVIAVVSPADVWSPIERVDSDPDLEEFAFEAGSGHLYLWGVKIRGDAGVLVHGSTQGVHGTVHVERASFDTQRSAISMEGGVSHLRNTTLVGANLGDASTIHVRGYSDLDVTFSTIVARFADLALRCDPIVPSSSSIVVRNSIVGSMTSNDGLVISASCNDLFSNIAYETGTASLNDSNKEIGSLVSSDFVDVADGDLHLLSNPSKFDGIAQWSPGDPLVDIDGETRETQALTWPGADHPQ
jgi:hypothetical protein